MRLIFISVFLGTTVLVTAGTFWSCPAGYQSSDNIMCFKLFETKMDREAASLMCQSDGATLAVIDNAFANSFVSTILRNSTSEGAWLGITCGSSLESCKNDDGSKVMFNNFQPGRSFGSHDCVLLSQRMTWYQDVQCSVKQSAVCGIPAEKSNCPQNYVQRNGHCYKYVEVLSTLMEAETICREENGHVSSIHSQLENDFIKNLVKSQRTKEYGSVYIGLQMDERNKNHWLDDSNFDYANFESTDAVAGQCYAMLLDGITMNIGTWLRESCQVPTPFVCKSEMGTTINPK